MNIKKLVIFVLSSVLIAAIVGFFYYYYFYQTPPEKWDLADYSPSEDYIVTTKNGETRVENKKAGISFIVPDEWDIERVGGQVQLLKKGTVINSENPYIIDSGARILIVQLFIKTTLHAVESELRNNSIWGEHITKIDIEKVGGHDVLSYKSEIENINLYHAAYLMPVSKVLKNPYLLSIGIDCNLLEKEICNNILTSLKYNLVKQ